MTDEIVALKNPSNALQSYDGSQADDDRIDLHNLWSIFRRRLGVFIAVLLTVVTLGLFLSLRQAPVYTASAQVSLVTRQEPIVPSAANRTEPQGAPSETFVDTQVSLITSEKLAGMVADALKLSGDQRIQSIQAAKDTGISPRQAALDYLRDRVSASRFGTTYALDIRFEDTDPVQAARFANEYAKQYTAGMLNAEQADNRQSNGVIAQRMDGLRERALADSAAVQQFRIANNLLSTSGASLTEQEISSYNQAVATAKSQAAEDDARLSTARSQLRSGSRGDDVGEALNSSVVSSLRTQQAGLAGKVADLTAKYGDRHPDVQRARSELSSINDQIAAEIERTISNLAAKSKVSQGRLSSLSGTLAGARGVLAQNSAAMVRLNDLQQRATASQLLYEAYLNKYKEMSASEGTERPDADILTMAKVPDSPTSPNYVLNLIFSIGLGLGLGVAAAFILELSYSGLTTGADVERRLKVRFLGTIPTLSSVAASDEQSPMNALVNDARSAFAESLRGLRASIRIDGASAKVIAITSALPKEGKTTTAICLARSMALSGERVVLIDCDLRQRGVSRFVHGSEALPGFMEVLRGEAPLEQAIIRDGPTGMTILPVSSRDNQDTSELMTGAPMDALLSRLRMLYDVVILDLAPVLPIADTRVMIEKADTTIFMVRWRKTPDHAVRAALRLLPTSGSRLAGIALTRVNMRKQGRFAHGDEAYYYREYKSYYGS